MLLRHKSCHCSIQIEPLALQVTQKKIRRPYHDYFALYHLAMSPCITHSDLTSCHSEPHSLHSSHIGALVVLWIHYACCTSGHLYLIFPSKYKCSNTHLLVFSQMCPCHRDHSWHSFKVDRHTTTIITTTTGHSLPFLPAFHHVVYDIVYYLCSYCSSKPSRK